MSLFLLSPLEMAKRKYGSGTIRMRGDRFEIGYRIKGRQVWERTNTDDKDIAETLLQKRCLEIRVGKEDQMLGTRFGDLAARWLANKQNEGIRPRTYELWESIVRAHLNPAFENDFVHQVNNVAALEDYRDNKIAGNIVPVADGAHKGPLSPQTVSHHFTVIRQVLDYAMVLDLIDSNKAKLVKKPKIVRGQVEPVESANVKKLLAAMTPEHRTLFLLIVSCGLRVGEATGLRVQDFDSAKKLIKVQGAIKTKNNKLYRDDYPKTASGKRTLRISDDLANKIEKQIIKAKKRPDPDGLNLIFRNNAGRPLSRQNLRQRVLIPAAIAAGLIPTEQEALTIKAAGGKPKTIRIHDLRHTYASELLAAGVPITTVQHRGGWANAASMNRYSHLTASDKDEAADTSSLYN